MKSAAEIIELLQHIRSRKRMYFENVTVDAVENFISGFLLGIEASSLDIPEATWTEVLEARGWASVANKPSILMRERGITDEQIIEEEFDSLIEIIHLRGQQGIG
jgi:hypothetical protein